tara:strand:+ start:966 stop:1136 length:171 start_codon:yes stop_codon:yes gene_type:complete
MTSKEFKIWVDTFLKGANINETKLRKGTDPTYNHLTMIKTIQNKLKTVNDEKSDTK